MYFMSNYSFYICTYKKRKYLELIDTDYFCLKAHENAKTLPRNKKKKKEEGKKKVAILEYQGISNAEKTRRSFINVVLLKKGVRLSDFHFCRVFLLQKQATIF